MKWFRFALIVIGLLVVIGCSSKEDELFGTWETYGSSASHLPSPIRLEFRGDGIGFYEFGTTYQQVTWEITDDDELCFYITPSVSTSCREYSVEGDYLNYEIYRQPLEFKRQ